MIARIKTDNGFYNSIVFAIFENGWKSEAIIFNKDNTALQTVRMYTTTKRSIERNVFIYNAEKNKDWVEKDKVEGYDWVLENVTKSLLKTQIDECILSKCKEMQSNIKDCDWFDIKNESDIDGLMYAAFDFHDSYVKDIYSEIGKQYILFDTTWGCEILFELEGKCETNLYQGHGNTVIGDYLPLINDAAMFFHGNLIYWIENWCEDDSEDTAEDNTDESILDLDKAEFHYFCANKVKWKLIIR
ncbi:MAG: hypothetical protein J1F65_06270 [Clostridiales bacterium]|nr:hypothetical protein [Clostridiales bacterium]